MLAGWVPPSLHTWIKEWHRSKSAPDIFQPLDHIRNAFIRSPRTNHADPHFQIPISELTCKSSNRLIKVRSTPFSTFLPFVFYFLRSTSGTISTVIATHKGHQFKFQIWSWDAKVMSLLRWVVHVGARLPHSTRRKLVHYNRPLRLGHCDSC